MRDAISDPITPDQLLTSHEASALLQVNPSTINKWVQEGRLNAFRTPGGHRRIRAEDLVTFLDAYGMPIPRSFSFAVKRRLLIVDDEETQLSYLELLLAPHRDKLELLLISSGIDALLRVGAFQPHLIVLDVFMPDVDGMEVCRRLKANPATAASEVMITTAVLTPELEAQGREAGATTCVQKPIPLERLLGRLGIHSKRPLG